MHTSHNSVSKAQVLVIVLVTNPKETEVDVVKPVMFVNYQSVYMYENYTYGHSTLLVKSVQVEYLPELGVSHEQQYPFCTVSSRLLSLYLYTCSLQYRKNGHSVL